MITREQPVRKVLSARRESRQIEFKERFDPLALHDWCEVIKDVVAISNSGGGYILFGVNDDGSISNWDRSELCTLDPAKISDKITTYTGEHFSEFEIQEVERERKPIALMTIHAVHTPLVFTSPGTYPTEGGKQKTAFGKGTVYFRHGAKSEPGNSQDLRQSVRREIESTRKSWLGNIKKVVTAPRGHEVRILPPEVAESLLSSATPIRIVDDPSAPAYRKLDPDVTHPYRQKEVIEEVNKLLPDKRKITSYDIQCVRKAYKVNESRPDFSHQFEFASPQYSRTFVEWMVREHAKDPSFFDGARQAARSGASLGA